MNSFPASARSRETYHIVDPSFEKLSSSTRGYLNSQCVDFINNKQFTDKDMMQKFKDIEQKVISDYTQYLTKIKISHLKKITQIIIEKFIGLKKFDDWLKTLNIELKYDIGENEGSTIWYVSLLLADAGKEFIPFYFIAM